jgi:hypothetical protein
MSAFSTRNGALPPFRRNDDFFARFFSATQAIKTILFGAARFLVVEFYQKEKNRTRRSQLNRMTSKYIRCPYLQYIKWPKNIPKFSTPQHFQNLSKWDFWYENIPSGNPDSVAKHTF